MSKSTVLGDRRFFSAHTCSSGSVLVRVKTGQTAVPSARAGRGLHGLAAAAEDST